MYKKQYDKYEREKKEREDRNKAMIEDILKKKEEFKNKFEKKDGMKDIVGQAKNRINELFQKIEGGEKENVTPRNVFEEKKEAQTPRVREGDRKEEIGQ